MKELVFLLEEQSAKVLLQVLLSRLPEGAGILTRYVVFEGKGDLTRQLKQKLRGYQNQEARFLVMCGQDGENCAKTKHKLVDSCKSAGKFKARVTIACREIEAFYLRDLQAVERGLTIPNLARKQQTARFRNPDSVETPARVLESLTKHRYQKISGSRAIAPHLNIETPRSASLRYLISVIRAAAR